MKKVLALLFAISLVVAGCTRKDYNEKAEAKPEVKPEVKIEAKTDIKPEIKPEIKAVDTHPKGSMTAPAIYSNTMKIDWNYTAYMPAGYDANANVEYPVLYLLHGAYGNHRNLVERFPIQSQLDELMSNGKLEKMIVIFVDGFNSFYIDGPAFKIETAIIEDLIPQIEAKFNTKIDRDKRYIGGISMGGYGAANLTLKYPEIFSKAILISPAVWHEIDENGIAATWHLYRDESGKFSQTLWDSLHPEAYLKSFTEKSMKASFYVITGESDQVVSVDEVKEFVAKLDKVADVKAVYVKDGIHAWTFWEGATKQALAEF